jgi:NAD(P)-dependent dehydrogenase (short-subunit alcohol dehydrogenase family)
MRLKGKVAIVTGGGAGIGGAIAFAMAAEGATVALAEISPAAATQAITTILNAGGTAWSKVIDGADLASVNAFVKEAHDRHGQIDILVNTVGGIVKRGTILECDVASWDETFHRNLKSTYHACRAVLPHMLARRYGSIITMGSAAGLASRRRLSAYTAAKGAIISLTRQMAVDFGLEGVRVNCIAPGPVLTKRSREKYDKDPALHKRRANEQLLGRTGEPQDVAGMAVFLASDESSWITGHVFPVDGGSTAGQGADR